MRVFEETQRFKRWLTILISFFGIGMIFIAFYRENEGFIIDKEPISFLVTVLVIAFTVFILIFSRLETKIDNHGIYASFYPFSFLKKFYSWETIEKVYVRKYSAITEYGGWGARIIFSAKAYTVSGSQGIQIITKKGKQFLIGTHEPQKAERTLQNFQQKIKI